MTRTELLNAIAARCAELQIRLVKEAHGRLLRAGHRPQSMGEPSRSSESPIPVTAVVTTRDSDGLPSGWVTATVDPVDRDISRKASSYLQHVRRGLEHTDAGWRALIAGNGRDADRRYGLALREFDAAYEVQDWFLGESKAVPDVEYFVCTNPECQNEHTRKNGQCDRCRQWKARYGADFPNVRETA